MNPEDIFEDWSSVKKFADKEISEEILQEVFELTTKAPTAFNLQPYRFIVLDSDEARDKAVESAVPVNGWMKYADKIVVLVGDEEIDVHADEVLKHKMDKGKIDSDKAENLKELFGSYKERDKGFMTGWLTRNTMIPATFFMLACKTKEISTCPVRGFSQEKLHKKLDLKQSEKPILMMPIGYSKAKSEREWRRNSRDIYETL